MRSYQRKCRRCGGSGYFSRGGCFGCGGTNAIPGTGYTTVTVRTAEEKAESAATFQARVTLARAIDELPRDERWDAQDGFRHLEVNAPERFAKALMSVRNGRTNDVITALIAYWKEAHES